MYFLRKSGTSILSMIVLVSACIFNSGCATHNKDLQDIANNMQASKNANEALIKVKEMDPYDRDLVQYYLDLGYLQLVLGRSNKAIINLEMAKQLMEVLQAMSVTETAAATTINETLTSYDGSPTDQVLVHGMLALAYLQKGELSGARVEVLQADTAMKRLSKDKSMVGQLASVRFIAGMVYEMNDEHDSALISYRKSYNIMNDRETEIPEALKVSLLKMTKAVGQDEEYKKYVKKFGKDIEGMSKQPAKQFVVYFDGVISQMYSMNLDLLWDVENVYVTVALPEFKKEKYFPNSMSVKVDGVSTKKSQVIENLENRVREDLNDRLPAVRTRALLRAGTKYIVAKKIKERNPGVGALINVTTMLTEMADTRQWTMLPSNIQLVRFNSDDKQYSVTNQNKKRVFENTDKNYQILFLSSVSDKVFVSDIK